MPSQNPRDYTMHKVVKVDEGVAQCVRCKQTFMGINVDTTTPTYLSKTRFGTCTALEDMIRYREETARMEAAYEGRRDLSLKLAAVFLVIVAVLSVYALLH